MPILQPDQIYQLLRSLTSPVVAITSERGGTRNGMIADSAVRASIVPAIPRVSVYLHKFNYSLDLLPGRRGGGGSRRSRPGRGFRDDRRTFPREHAGGVAGRVRGATPRRAGVRSRAVAGHPAGGVEGTEAGWGRVSGSDTPPSCRSQ